MPKREEIVYRIIREWTRGMGEEGLKEHGEKGPLSIPLGLVFPAPAATASHQLLMSTSLWTQRSAEGGTVPSER